MTHDEIAALATRFCAERGLPDMRITVVDDLDTALRAVYLRGGDPRWRRVAGRGPLADVPTTAPSNSGRSRAQRVVLEAALKLWDIAGGPHTPTRPWFARHTVLSAAHWARLSLTLREAHAAGLGWVVPVYGQLLLVPAPVIRCAEGRDDVPHDDTGAIAVTWPNDAGYYFLHGVWFAEALYRDVLMGGMTLSAVAALGNADHRSIALRYLGVHRLVSRSGAWVLDLGVKGTTLYRLRLPRAIARDRPRGYGEFDYFIHMRDASHPEREFIEWVAPEVGRLGDAELCQARAFGITKEQWLAIEQEG